ncbi:choline/ethanolamine kinase family protein [Zhongshania sp. BJYM1]|uniref:choline/ethanolamine kinase family protein n=1 Tax=Zhongshania aquatica TaxID=2965069 RepID=UPI0022B49461|nr:choline/ethanolamine kinase family protein [Marortus sp. BJYM1]
MTDIIPADWSLWSMSKPEVIRPLLGGLTNKSYLISAGGSTLVLRQNSAISAALNLNRQTEAQVLTLADSEGLCAPLIHYDSDYQYMVSRYVTGRHWRADDHGLSTLAKLLARVHQLPAVDSYLDIEHKARSYWRAIDEDAVFSSDLSALTERVAEHIAGAKSFAGIPCVCHNDLLLENLIATDEGRLYAIDWEYAAMGDSFYDLAVIVEGHALNEQQQQLLLAEYLVRPVNTADWRRLTHWRVIYGYLTVLWYAVQWSSGIMKTADTSRDIAEQIRVLNTRFTS